MLARRHDPDFQLAIPIDGEVDRFDRSAARRLRAIEARTTVRAAHIRAEAIVEVEKLRESMRIGHAIIAEENLLDHVRVIHGRNNPALDERNREVADLLHVAAIARLINLTHTLDRM